jgi:hypothetical protein
MDNTVECRIASEFVDKDNGNRYYPGEFVPFGQARAKALQDKGLVAIQNEVAAVSELGGDPGDSWIERGKKSAVGATLEAMNKVEIEAYVLKHHGVNLDRRQSKARMIEHALDVIFC